MNDTRATTTPVRVQHLPPRHTSATVAEARITSTSSTSTKARFSIQEAESVIITACSCPVDQPTCLYTPRRTRTNPASSTIPSPPGLATTATGDERHDRSTKKKRYTSLSTTELTCAWGWKEVRESFNRVLHPAAARVPGNPVQVPPVYQREEVSDAAGAMLHAE
ncbi:hypothetical protein N7522_001413 [Penicillium canescens]|nr:hypothetical protein N7522_001413 [Penicillium canescens]